MEAVIEQVAGHQQHVYFRAGAHPEQVIGHMNPAVGSAKRAEGLGAKQRAAGPSWNSP